MATGESSGDVFSFVHFGISTPPQYRLNTNIFNDDTSCIHEYTL